MTLPKSATDNHIAKPREDLSNKPLPWSERLIVALDTPDIHDAKRLVTLLGEQVHFYKLGLELFMAGGYFELLEWLTDQGKKIFVDLKFFDVPQTVMSAVKQLADPQSIRPDAVHRRDRAVEHVVAAAERASPLEGRGGR